MASPVFTRDRAGTGISGRYRRVQDREHDLGPLPQRPFPGIAL
jgi:hypothetical protein